jgi:hypothetical protein
MTSATIRVRAIPSSRPRGRIAAAHHLAQHGGAGGAADQHSEQAVAGDRYQGGGGQRDTDGEEHTHRLAVHGPAGTPAAADQQGKRTGDRGDDLLPDKRPGAGAGDGGQDRGGGPKSLANERAHGEMAVGALARQQPLYGAGGADKWQRCGKDDCHRNQSTVTEDRRETPARRTLQQHRHAADHDGSPERAGQGSLVDGVPLDQGIGEQGVHHHPEDDIDCRDGRADAKLRRADDAGDRKGRNDREGRGDTRLQPRPESVSLHGAGMRRGSAADEWSSRSRNLVASVR